MSPDSGARLEQKPETRLHAPVEGGRTDSGALPGVASPVAGLSVFALQRTAGNAAVAQLLSRAPRPASPPGATGALPAVQREIPPPPRNEADELPENYEAMSDGEKAVAIRGMLGAKSGSAIYRAWAGLKNPIMIARESPDMFTASMAKNDEIVDLAGFNLVRDDFQKAVIDTASGYLSKNKAAIGTEREKLGVPPANASQTPSAAPTFEQDAAVQEAQRAAEDMERVKTGKKKCSDTLVGTNTKVYSSEGGPVSVDESVFFTPGRAPQFDRTDGPTYSVVMEAWRVFISTEAGLVRDHPEAAFFIGEGGDPSKIGKEASVAAARAQIANALTELEGRIDKAIPLIGSDITFTDLVPIHEQLMAGPVWSKPVEKAVAKETVSDANLTNLLKTLGIGTLSAALFIFAEIVSGGGASALAPFLFAAGGAISVGQAAASWKDYSDLATANKASINPEEQLVSGEQVDEAMRSAILDTVFAAMDGWQAGKGIYTGIKGGKAILVGARAGSQAGIRKLLPAIDSAPDKADLLRRAVAELGPEATQRATGKPYKELAGMVGADTPLGKQLAELEATAGRASAETRTLLEKAPNLAKLDAIEGDQVLAALVQTRGYVGALEAVGGWGALRKMEAMKGATGKAMESWRAGLVKELEEYIAKESEGMTKAVRTGTEKATSDLDVQVVGGAAGELQSRAEGWLGGRLGTNSKKAKVLLDAEIFVDPTRAHLIDIINSPEITQEVRDQISARMHQFETRAHWSAQYARAKGVSDEAAQKVIADARSFGVDESMIDKGFKLWSSAQQKAASKEIDGLMATVAETKDPKLIEEIAQKQAFINASHSDAYVGGGVRVWVTGREEDAAKLAEALGTTADKLTAVTAKQRIMAVVSEGKWLDAAVQTLSQGSADLKSLTRAITNAGKHGQRAATVLKAAGAPNATRLEILGNMLLKYKDMTSEEVAAVISRGELRQTANEITATLDMLKEATGKGVTALADEAKALGLPATDLAELQKWYAFQANYAAAVKGLNSSTWGAVRELEAFASAGTQSSIYDVPPDQSVAPRPPKPAPPQQSVMPQPWEEPQSIPP